MDFFSVASTQKNGKIVIEPAFKVKRTRDFMIRGRAFYAIWDEANHIWSREESDVSRLVDEELGQVLEEQQKVGNFCDVVWMSNYNKGSWQRYKSYLSNMFDTYIPLDTKVTFRSQVCERKDYRSKRLPYDLEDGEPEAYNELMSTLYSKEERRKLEWAIGSVLNGDSSTIQKFIVLYGEPGAGKSTFLHIVEQLFEGYWTTFDAKSLTGKGSGFSTHFFAQNPLVAIQHDGDLSKIEDGTLLNSIISHEDIVVNEKFKAQYVDRSNCLLFIGTNNPVKISDSKSGLIRRLIDVSPSGKRVPVDRYFVLMDLIPFELGKIASRCLRIYRALGKKYYNNYKPLQMMYMTDPFFNFVNENMDAFLFNDEEYISLSHAYDIYTNWCETVKEPYILKRSKFRDELKSYFLIFRDSVVTSNGKTVKSVYSGFKKELFDPVFLPEEMESEPLSLALDSDKSIFDEEYADCPAQYAKPDGTPSTSWDSCKTKLKDLDTTKCHYIRPAEPNHIVLDFDLKNANGEKDAYLNLREASKWPPTYAEFSQGGAGIHLHYIYDGDASKLSRLVSNGIEVKVLTGKSSLRRRLTKCNNLPIAHISSGLPLQKEVKKTIDTERVSDERHLRRLIEMGLRKEVHSNTKPCMDFIFKVLDDAYKSGINYDVRDMRNKVLTFAMQSSNQSDACLKLLDSMKFYSDDYKIEAVDKPFSDDAPIVFFDVELFPNFFYISWKYAGDDEKCVHMYNPSPKEVSDLFQYRLIAFNNRRYDNHILYARYLGWSVGELYKLSNNIINSEGGILKYGFREAYNISYTDIYDFAAKKQSLKKWEIEMGIHHQELGIPFNEPVDESRWEEVAAYCDNDVIAAEKLFGHLKGDWTARQILAKIAGMTPNSTTNQLTTKIIFGDAKNPKLEYTHLENTFPGYELKYDPVTRKNVNWYRDTDVGFGGYVYGEEGMYKKIALLDIISMHPHSLIAMNYLGEYTERFKALMDARIFIKHGDFESASKLMDGAFAEFLTDPSIADDLAQALKIAINSVYGLTSASFPNAFRHPENVNNIVALRGALFMRTLQDEVTNRGYKVVSIRTDSIKIANADDDIINFCMEFAKSYGYTFEHEATYERMCLTTKADYIAIYDSKGIRNKGGKHANEWTATGAKFQHPVIFKSLFSREPIEFEDMRESKEVKAPAAIYLDMNEGLPDVTVEEKLLEKALKNPDTDQAYIDDLRERIAKGHNYIFVGRVGSFMPMREGAGGGVLVAKRGDKYSAVAGTKGYRWLEDEVVQTVGKENELDNEYYRQLVDEAVAEISKYGDFEAFVG